MICNKCHKQIKDGSTVCPYCNSPVYFEDDDDFIKTANNDTADSFYSSDSQSNNSSQTSSVEYKGFEGDAVHNSPIFNDFSQTDNQSETQKSNPYTNQTSAQSTAYTESSSAFNSGYGYDSNAQYSTSASQNNTSYSTSNTPHYNNTASGYNYGSNNQYGGTYANTGTNQYSSSYTNAGNTPYGSGYTNAGTNQYSSGYTNAGNNQYGGSYANAGNTQYNSGYNYGGNNSYNNGYNNTGNSPYNNGANYNSAPGTNQTSNDSNESLSLIKLLGFFLGLFTPAVWFLPIASIILYFVWRKDKHPSASAIAKFTMIGILTGYGILILLGIIFTIVVLTFTAGPILEFARDFAAEILSKIPFESLRDFIVNLFENVDIDLDLSTISSLSIF